MKVREAIKMIEADGWVGNDSLTWPHLGPFR